MNNWKDEVGSKFWVLLFAKKISENVARLGKDGGRETLYRRDTSLKVSVCGVGLRSMKPR